MSKMIINDISMYYEVHGKGEPIVFIAGLGADHTNWKEIIDRFKDNYQVVVFDNRGAGQTDVPEGPYSIEQMADDVFVLCSKLGIHHAHFIGSSMGGFILQTLALHHPKLVKSATICNATSTIHSCFHLYLSAHLNLLKSTAPKELLFKASITWLFSYRFLSQPGMVEELIRLGMNNPHPFTIKGFEGQYAAIEQFDSRPWTSKIEVPTLVLASNEDLIFNEEAVNTLAKQIPNATYYCFSACGHLPQIECPEEFTKVVLAFIAKGS